MNYRKQQGAKAASVQPAKKHNRSEGLKLHKSNVYAYGTVNPYIMAGANRRHYGGYGSYGLNHNPNNTIKPPYIVMVDVNGDKNPTPTNISCRNTACTSQNLYKVPLPSEKKVRDIFSVLITKDRAIPYGVTAQKAMYQAAKVMREPERSSMRRALIVAVDSRRYDEVSECERRKEQILVKIRNGKALPHKFYFY